MVPVGIEAENNSTHFRDSTCLMKRAQYLANDNVVVTQHFHYDARHMDRAVAVHLAEDAAGLAVGLVHQAEDGEVPAVELRHEGLQVGEAHHLQGLGGFLLLGQRSRFPGQRLDRGFKLEDSN